MLRRLLLLLLFPLSSCSSVKMDAEQLICLFCVHTKVKAEKRPEQVGPSKTKSTEDFSDPQKDQTPQDDADKKLPVKPDR